VFDRKAWKKTTIIPGPGFKAVMKFHDNIHEIIFIAGISPVQAPGGTIFYPYAGVKASELSTKNKQDG